MPDPSIDAQMQLEQLRQEYFNRLSSRLQAIEACWHQLSIEWHPETLKTLHRLVHSLSGTSATYGLTTLGETARRLEQQLQSWTAADPPNGEEWQQAHARLLQIQQQVMQGSSSCKVNAVCEINTANLTEVNDHLDDALAVAVQPCLEKGLDAELDPQCLETQSKVALSSVNKRLVFLFEENQIEEDPSAVQELTLQISYFGYEVRTFHQLDRLKQATVETCPAVILFNLTETTVITDLNSWRASDDHSSDPKNFNLQNCDLQNSNPQNFGRRPFIIFISIYDDLATRLQAVRAGGDAYFTKPINVCELIDKLDQLIQHFQVDPYRILIVEDDRELAEFHALTLQQAGMLTHLVTDPLGILQPLNEFKPNLILMDIYMPSCSGQELAAVIRQQVAYVSIPIVFLSSETDLNKQLAAMRLGGDDFLTKPIQPQHLISSVASRARRSATLRSYMVRDSLTGLLNHTKLKEQLAIELKRAQRQNSLLAFVMIDIDHFKGVNDTYGHPTGDRVIKSLSRLLQQRLRQTDVIGRYGGEEFAVILVDTNASAAVQVMEQIRQSFAQVQQRAEGGEFNVTVSCGIALSSTCPTVAQISKAADKALYRAKQAGRNRVVLATDDLLMQAESDRFAGSSQR